MKAPFPIRALFFLGVGINVAHAMRKSLDVKALGRSRMPADSKSATDGAQAVASVASAMNSTPGHGFFEESEALASGTPGGEFSEESHTDASSFNSMQGRGFSEESQALVSGINSTPGRELLEEPQAVASSINSTPGHGLSDESYDDGSQGHVFITTLSRSALLEQSSLFLQKLKASGNYNVTLLLSLSVILTICCLSVVVAFVRRKGDDEDSDGEGLGLDSDDGSKQGVEVEVTMTELVKRLAKTVRKLPVGKISFLAGSHTGTGMKERHLGIWWGTKSHTWASTRLGWWESMTDHRQRSQPLNSIYLKDVSEVRLTDDEDNYPDPGICIAYSGQQGQTDNLFLFFATEDNAIDYAKDLRMMVERVKKADAAERSSKS